MLQASLQLYKNAYGGIPKPVWWLSLVMLVNRSGTMVIPFMTVYLVEKGFTVLHAGYIMAAFGLGSVLGAYWGGRLTDKFGSYYIQVLSLMLNGIMFIVLGQMQSFAQFAVCIFVLSTFGEAFRPANAAAIANYCNDNNRVRAYALNRLAINVGWGIGPAVGGMLADYNYALLFWADGLTCIIASFLLFILIKPRQKINLIKTSQKEEAPSSAYKDVFFMKGMFYLFLITLAFFQLFNVIPLYYSRELLLSGTVIGIILAMNGFIIALVEMILVYKLEKRNHSIIYIVTGALLVGCSFLFLETGTTVMVAVISMLLVTCGEMFLFPFLNSFWVARSTEKNRGQYAAVYTMSFAAASVLAPTIGTQIAAHLGFSVLWVVDFIFCAIAAIGFYFLKKSLT